MSRLPNAPLLEVIFELRWNALTQEATKKWQYLHGDLYSLIRDKYPVRELINNVEVPKEILFHFQVGQPIHRFRPAQDTYPLVQLGPGLLTLNTVDRKYSWTEYSKNILDISNKFFEVHPIKDSLALNLQYFDFFSFDFENSNVLDFLSKNLKIDMKQGFQVPNRNLDSLDLGLTYNITTDSRIFIGLNKGINEGKDGLILRTMCQGKNISPKIESIHDWIEKSHEMVSQLFKDMTSGEMYESFNTI